MLSVAGQVAMTALVPPHGGPIVPDATMYILLKVPVALVEVRLLAEYDGAVQPTDTSELTGAGRATVGSPSALLHSKKLPVEEWV